MCGYHIWQELTVVAVGPRFVTATEHVRSPSGVWEVVPLLLQLRHRHREIIQVGNSYQVGGRYRSTQGERGPHFDYVRVWYLGPVSISTGLHQYPLGLADSGQRWQQPEALPAAL